MLERMLRSSFEELWMLGLRVRSLCRRQQNTLKDQYKNGIKVKVKSLSRAQLFTTPWAVAYQAPLSMGFSMW